MIILSKGYPFVNHYIIRIKWLNCLKVFVMHKILSIPFHGCVNQIFLFYNEQYG